MKKICHSYQERKYLDSPKQKDVFVNSFGIKLFTKNYELAFSRKLNKIQLRYVQLRDGAYTSNLFYRVKP